MDELLTRLDEAISYADELGEFVNRDVLGLYDGFPPASLQESLDRVRRELKQFKWQVQDEADEQEF